MNAAMAPSVPYRVVRLRRMMSLELHGRILEKLDNYMGECVESQRRLAERDEFFFCTNASHITRFTAHLIIQFQPTE